MVKSRRVVQYTMEGEAVRTYGSIREAQTYMGVTHISSVCRNKRVSDGGYRWGYEGDELKELTEKTLRRSLGSSFGPKDPAVSEFGDAEIE